MQYQHFSEHPIHAPAFPRPDEITSKWFHSENSNSPFDQILESTNKHIIEGYRTKCGSEERRCRERYSHLLLAPSGLTSLH